MGAARSDASIERADHAVKNLRERNDEAEMVQRDGFIIAAVDADPTRAVAAPNARLRAALRQEDDHLAGCESLIFRELIDFVESLGPVGEHFGDQGRLIGKNVLRIGRRAIDDHIGITIRVNPGADLNIDRLSLARPAFQALFQGLPQVQRDIIVRPG
jgi:hypothetical protein